MAKLSKEEIDKILQQRKSLLLTIVHFLSSLIMVVIICTVSA